MRREHHDAAVVEVDAAHDLLVRLRAEIDVFVGSAFKAAAPPCTSAAVSGSRGSSASSALSTPPSWAAAQLDRHAAHRDVGGRGYCCGAVG